MSGPRIFPLSDLDPIARPPAYVAFLDLLRDGAVVAYPAETMYGIGALGPDRENDARVNAVKGRAPDRPLIYLCDDWERCAPFCARGDGLPRKFADRFWPGPITLVLPRRDGAGTIAFRAPDLPHVGAWVRDTGAFLSSTSANRTGEPPVTRERGLVDAFRDRVDIIVLGGDFPDDPAPSTLVRIDNGRWSVLRDGAVPAARFEDL